MRLTAPSGPEALPGALVPGHSAHPLCALTPAAPEPGRPQGHSVLSMPSCRCVEATLLPQKLCPRSTPGGGQRDRPALCSSVSARTLSPAVLPTDTMGSVNWSPRSPRSWRREACGAELPHTVGPQSSTRAKQNPLPERTNPSAPLTFGVFTTSSTTFGAFTTSATSCGAFTVLATTSLLVESLKEGAVSQTH